MQFLDKILLPSDLKNLKVSDLKLLSKELREEVIRIISTTGGHLGASLGVVELTVALHYVFNAPEDKLVWDVGHQSYPHKILTDRRKRMETLRQFGGISAFTKTSESIYDTFGAGHSSTSISAALGMAVARDVSKKNHEVIAIIGDGAMSAGMAYEAINNVSSVDSRIIVILNDNEMSISPAVGGMNKYLRNLVSRINEDGNDEVESLTFSNISIRTIFDEFEFKYVGPVDGYDVELIASTLESVKNDCNNKKFFIHVITEKGKGFDSREKSDECYHAVGKFDINSKEQFKKSSTVPSYTSIFSKTIVKIAEQDKGVMAITAAMESGTGLAEFKQLFPSRFFDVGIAEQHAVTFAAGMAISGLKPFCCIYSTFLQRAYDQIIHDVAIQKLPVRFMVDRAGIVGADGATHTGAFDMSYLNIIPNFVIMAPSDEAELAKMIYTAYTIDDCPCAVRYPRGAGLGVEFSDELGSIAIGKGRIVRKCTNPDIVILSIGNRMHDSISVAKTMKDDGVDITVIDMRFLKPLDEKLILDVLSGCDKVITVEESSYGGGLGCVVRKLLSDNNILCKIRSVYMPDEFVEHGEPEFIRNYIGIGYDSILDMCREIME